MIKSLMFHAVLLTAKADLKASAFRYSPKRMLGNDLHYCWFSTQYFYLTEYLTEVR